MRRNKPPRRRQASARALAEPRFRARIVRNRTCYTRKGRDPQGRGPFDSRSPDRAHAAVWPPRAVVPILAP